jgi:hydrogenase expression/formation protein HypC
MCLGLPCEVVRLIGDDVAVVRADHRGERKVSVAMLEGDPVVAGDWVMVHLGFAMAKVEAAEAAETLAFLDELGQQSI